MTVRVEIHPNLRRLVGGADHFMVEATTVGGALEALTAASSFEPIMFAWVSRRHPGVAVFRSKELLRGRYHSKPLRDGDVLRLVAMM